VNFGKAIHDENFHTKKASGILTGTGILSVSDLQVPLLATLQPTTIPFRTRPCDTMLSNPPPSNLHARQRQHRRQNSTPTAFEAVKIPALPNVQHPRAGGHRRGLSLDTRRRTTTTIPSPTTLRQEMNAVSMNTNTGLATTPSSRHHVLREAQQQRIQARPGPQQQQHPQVYANLASANDHENYLISPHGTPHNQRFDPSCFDPAAVPFDQYNAQMSMVMQKNQANMGPAMGSGKDFELFAPDSAMSTPTFMNFHESPAAVQGWISDGDTNSTRRTSRRISNGIMDRVAKFETMGIDGSQRPITPPNQNANSKSFPPFLPFSAGISALLSSLRETQAANKHTIQAYFPPTPMETPHDRMMKHEQQTVRLSRFSDGYDESMEETIKPGRNRSNQRTQSIFEDMRRQAEQAAIPTPPRSNTMPCKVYDAPVPTPADYMSMNNFNSEFMKIHGGFETMECHPDDGMDVPSDLVHGGSADVIHMGQYGNAFNNRPDLRPLDNVSQPASPSRSAGPSRRGSPHRRTESLASIASAASIASINIDETKTETGVTIEDIAAYIHGPDPADGKWTCLFDGCDKKFGRKENIKSHVQTHLNDRQYQCPTCNKCFVRQHDLKRHAKIHTGIKPYPCECGNSFARHDALTRHRQRGMCIGAFDGIVRKVVKRGRPRKHRPDMDSRLEKSARTRNKNKSPGSTSSQSGYSDSSAANSPHNDFDMLDDDDFNNLMDVGMNNGTTDLSLSLAVSSAPMPSIAPTVGMEYAHSPSAGSQHSYVSPEAIMEPPTSLPHHPPSPAKSVASQYNTPPELSQSSSPPPTRFFELEPNTSGCTDDSMLGGVAATAGRLGSGNAMANTLTVGISEADDDMLLQAFTNDDGLVQLERDPSMLMMSKFDEEFDNAVSMFTNGDDVFFGSG
jgi:regulatory protein SWI5